MSSLFTDVDASLIGLVLACLMLAGWRIGLWLGRRAPGETCERTEGKFTDASIAILGLLLAFTFSLSLTKHEQRRIMVVNDSNAIGDFYTCASLQREPMRGKLRTLVRFYAELRLKMTQGSSDGAGVEKDLAEAQQMHSRMQDLVDEALQGQTPSAIPLVNTLNALTSSHATRLAAGHDRLPPSIVLVLMVAGVITMSLMGIQQGLSGERHKAATLSFVVLVSLIVWVTLDLNQPSKGMITVSQESLERLLAGMAK